MTTFVRRLSCPQVASREEVFTMQDTANLGQGDMHGYSALTFHWQHGNWTCVFCQD